MPVKGSAPSRHLRTPTDCTCALSLTRSVDPSPAPNSHPSPLSWKSCSELSLSGTVIIGNRSHPVQVPKARSQDASTATWYLDVVDGGNISTAKSSTSAIDPAVMSDALES